MRFLIQIPNFAVYFSIYFSFAASNEVDENLFLPADDSNHGDGQLTFLADFEDGQGSTLLHSNDDSASLFSSNEDLAPLTPITQDLSSVLFSYGDSVSAPVFDEDPVLLLASGEVPASGFYDPPLPNLPEELETPTENENPGFALDPELDPELDPDLLADIDCESYEEQTVGKARRGDMCRPVAERPTRKKSFPPPYSNQNRINWLPENAPKPRPAKDKKNTRFDFESCPAGLGGYRMYAVCDSGKGIDRVFSDERGWTLLNVDPGMLLFPCPLTCWHQIAKSQTCRKDMGRLHTAAQVLVLSRILY